jgi:hypothetical protein
MRKTVLGFALALLFLVSGCAKKTSTSPSAAVSDSVSASPSAETSSSPSVAPESYAISYQVVGQGNVTLSKSSATAGETITATAVSGADYHFVSLTSDDVTLTEADTAGTYTFVMPGKGVSLVATFAVNQEYELLKLGVFNLEDDYTITGLSVGDKVKETTPCQLTFTRMDSWYDSEDTFVVQINDDFYDVTWDSNNTFTLDFTFPSQNTVIVLGAANTASATGYSLSYVKSSGYQVLGVDETKKYAGKVTFEVIPLDNNVLDDVTATENTSQKEIKLRNIEMYSDLVSSSYIIPKLGADATLSPTLRERGDAYTITYVESVTGVVTTYLRYRQPVMSSRNLC